MELIKMLELYVDAIANQGEVLLYAAGVLQLIMLAASWTLPQTLNYKENLAKVAPLIRQLFYVHTLFISFILMLFALLCIGFTEELLGGSAVGTLMSGFMALFWGIRIVIQLSYYDPELRSEHRLEDVSFTLALIFLTITFSATAFGILS